MTPYSNCGEVSPGDIIIGDVDGIVVATLDVMENVIARAEQIVCLERNLMDAMKKGASIHSMTNNTDNVARIQAGKESTLEFNLN